jgi:hypothetical protein
MKRSNRKRHRPKEAVAKRRQADEALAMGKMLAQREVSPTGSVPDHWESLPMGNDFARSEGRCSRKPEGKLGEPAWRNAGR